MMKITRLGTLFSSDYGCQAVVFSYDGLVVMNDEISLRLGTTLIRETRNQIYLVGQGTAMIKLRIGWVPFSFLIIDVKQFLFSYGELVVMNDEISLRLGRNMRREIKHISRDRKLR